MVNWYKENLPVGTLGKFMAKRFEVSASDGTNIIIKRSFYDESISKYQDDPMYPLKLEYAKKAHKLIKTATLVDPNEKALTTLAHTLRFTRLLMIAIRLK